MTIFATTSFKACRGAACLFAEPVFFFKAAGFRCLPSKPLGTSVRARAHSKKHRSDAICDISTTPLITKLYFAAQLIIKTKMSWSTQVRWERRGRHEKTIN